jgi:hypothetical protein
MNITRFTIYTFLAAVLCAAGCATPKPAPDPLASWTRCWSQDPKDFDKITADCRVYINSLPQELRLGVGPFHYFEDGTGQHAIRFETGANGVNWSNVLIYDTDNNRIRVIKFESGHYRS